MKMYNTMSGLPGSFPTGPPDGITFEIQTAFMKAWAYIHGFRDENGEPWTLYPKIMVSVSGGADSDIIVDLIERIGHPQSEVRYVFYETGMEFDATRRHLTYLENRYGIQIEHVRAAIHVPLGVRKYGITFLSKRVSDYTHRLQKHGFQWEDAPLSELLRKYPRCQSALRWWCNEWGQGSQMNIRRHRWLREFMTEHPPDFPISDGCCTGAKKASARRIVREFLPDLNIQGLSLAIGPSSWTSARVATTGQVKGSFRGNSFKSDLCASCNTFCPACGRQGWISFKSGLCARCNTDGADAYTNSISFKSGLCARCNFFLFLAKHGIIPSSRACAHVATWRLSERDVPKRPSSRACAHVATAILHKISDSCTDYYVHILTFSSVLPALKDKVLRSLSRFWDGKSPQRVQKHWKAMITYGSHPFLFQ